MFNVEAHGLQDDLVKFLLYDRHKEAKRKKKLSV